MSEEITRSFPTEQKTPHQAESQLNRSTTDRQTNLPLIIGGVIVVALICIIGIVGMMSFFIIIEAEGEMVQAANTVGFAKEVSARENQADDLAFQGEVLFEETFDSNKSDWELASVEDEYGWEAVTIADGIYTLEVTPKQSVYIEKELPHQTFADFVLTVDMTPADSEAHYAYGVTFRQNNNLDSYVVELVNDGTFAIFRFDEEGWTTLHDWEMSEAIRPGETNSLTIVAEGQRLAFLVNGEPLTTLQDSALATGSIGLVVEAFQAGSQATVQFDNLIIRKP